MSFISSALSRKFRAVLIVVGLTCGLLTAGISYYSMARADGPPTSGPSSRPSVDEAIAQMHEGFDEMGQALGGLTDDEKTKLAAFEKQAADQIRANPSKLEDREFQMSVMIGVRGVLNAEHQKKFDAMMERSRKLSLRIATGADLRMIGMTCLLYSSDNSGKMPPDLGALAEDIPSPEVFMVAGSKVKVPAEWKTMDAKAKAEWVNKNTDYVYLAGGQTGTVPANFIVAYVKPEAFADGNIFLMGDGSIQDKSADEAKAIIADLKSGKNPPQSMSIKAQ